MSSSLASSTGTTNPLKVDRLPAVIEPARCLVNDFEILAFDTEEKLDIYSIWNELLYLRRKESKAENDQERFVIQNEILRKSTNFLYPGSFQQEAAQLPSTTTSRHSRTSSTPRRPNAQRARQAQVLASGESFSSRILAEQHQQLQSNLSRSSPTKSSSSRRGLNQSTAAAAAAAAAAAKLAQAAAQQSQQSLIDAYTPVSGTATLKNGLSILNSQYYKTLPNSKQLMKYKLTKLYNKYYGRQQRRDMVLGRQLEVKIREQVAKSYLNSWSAYTALQALRVPDQNYNQRSAVTGMNVPKFLAPIQQPLITENVTMDPKKFIKLSKKQRLKHILKQQALQAQNPPMQIVYVDPGNLITYSNRINPQQVVDYKQRSHIMPNSSVSKKSSAASYDVYEIMDVLANTTKTNVTITRNTNKLTNSGTPYSHSVNANNPGIVSTQLHLQAKLYLDSVRKTYAEERELIEAEEQRLRCQPPIDDLVGKYIKLDKSSDSMGESISMDCSSSFSSSDLNQSGGSSLEAQKSQASILSSSSAKLSRPTQAAISQPVDQTNGISQSMEDNDDYDEDDEIEKLEYEVMLTLKEIKSGGTINKLALSC